MITIAQIAQIIPVSGPHAATFVGPLNDAMARFGITTPQRQAAFLAQVAEESAGLLCTEESLNYSAEALHRSWPSHFDMPTATAYAHDRVRIANRAYANRKGNGDEASGDGYRFRGRGLFQITFRDNYAACGHGLGLDLVANPDLLLQPENAALSAAWYWSTNGLNALADAGNFTEITQRINGGQNGAAVRVAYWERAKRVLGA